MLGVSASTVLWLGPSPAPAPVSAAAATASTVPLSDCVSADNGDPVLSGLELSPASVDVRRRAGWVTIRVMAADTGGPGPATGLAQVRVEVNNPKGGGWGSVLLQPEASEVWVGRFRVPRGAPPGEWRVSGVHLTDEVGQSRTVYRQDLDSRGMPRRFTVVSAQDRKAPVVSSFTVSRQTVDVRTARRNVTVSARVRDNAAGVSYLSVSLRLPNRSLFGVDLVRVAGNLRDGVWRGTLRLPPDARSGRYGWSVQVQDKVRRMRELSAVDLVPLGSGGAVNVVGYRDSTDPVVSEASVDRSEIDVRDGDQDVTFRARVRDAESGVLFVGVRGVKQRAGRLVSGTVRDGVWETTVTFERCRSRSSDYRAQAFARDRAGRWGEGALPAVAVVAGDHQVPVADVPSVPLPAGGALPVTFGEDVVGLTEQSAVMVRWNGYPASGEPLAGSWSCADAQGSSVDCLTGPLRSARFVPAAPLDQGASYALVLNPERVLSLTDLAGNPFDRDQFLVFISDDVPRQPS